MLAFCSAKQLQETKSTKGTTHVIEGHVHGSDFVKEDDHELDEEIFYDYVGKAVLDKDLRGTGMLDEEVEHAKLVVGYENCPKPS